MNILPKKEGILLPTPEEWKGNYAYFIAVRSLSLIHMVKYVEEHD
jgi:hypothetical protein